MKIALCMTQEFKNTLFKPFNKLNNRMFAMLISLSPITTKALENIDDAKLREDMTNMIYDVLKNTPQGAVNEDISIISDIFRGMHNVLVGLEYGLKPIDDIMVLAERNISTNSIAILRQSSEAIVTFLQNHGSNAVDAFNQFIR